MKAFKFVALGSVLLATTALTSCNTALGFGRDLQQAGEGIEKTVYRRDQTPANAGSQNSYPNQSQGAYSNQGSY
jgi:predicted small secreted protein